MNGKTKTTKSVKIQLIEKYTTMIMNYGDGRYNKVWRDYETGLYHMEAGYDGLGRDWHATYETIAELRQEMGDLRNWVISEY